MLFFWGVFIPSGLYYTVKRALLSGWHICGSDASYNPVYQDVCVPRPAGRAQVLRGSGWSRGVSGDEALLVIGEGIAGTLGKKRSECTGGRISSPMRWMTCRSSLGPGVSWRMISGRPISSISPVMPSVTRR